MFGYEETWDSAKKHILSDIKILEKLREFTIHGKDEKFNTLRKKYFTNPEFKKDDIIK